MTRGLATFSIAVFVSLAVGCHPGVGERCNPLRFSDDCPGGTLCVYPANCGVAYCCPQVFMSAPAEVAVPNCAACATDDAGATD